MPDQPVTFHRHDLLRLARNAAFTPESGSDPGLIRAWLADGLPVIVRRPCHTAAGVHCGIPLPPAMGKLRLAFAVAPEAVRETLPLPRLSECLPLLPEARRRAWRGLSESLDPEVFGSLAWQRLTGMTYLHRNSDIDLLCRAGRQAELEQLLRRLRAAEPPPDGDIEIMLWNHRAFSRREFERNPARVLLKTDHDALLLSGRMLDAPAVDPELIAAEAIAALHEELSTYPKPGLVSYVDRGSHPDMDHTTFRSGIAALHDYFRAMAEAGGRDAGMDELRAAGIAAEQRMTAATGGINTHRGAIFSLGLLAAAAGYRAAGRSDRNTPEVIVAARWGEAIRAGHNPGSHGDLALRRHGGTGAATEAAAGFPAVRRHGLPAFRAAVGRHERNTARLHAFYALLEQLNDTTLLHRGGREGRDFARAAAAEFNRAGGVNASGWSERVRNNHREFVRRNLSCGGVADLLAATLFLHRLEELWQD